tara:strand:+ start:866 stop:2470 length:1605 start_codon:yes stop_codon:yes gene_type:complete
MSSSFIKVQANQATISASQNLLDFEVPDYVQGIDMEKSFVNITYTIDTTETTPALQGVHNFITMFNGIGANRSNGLFNSCLVRNVVLTADKAGQLESIQRADLINQVKQQFTKNIGDIQGELHESILNLPFEKNYGMNSSRNLITEGTMGVSTDVARYERQGVMRVNLKDVLGLGSSTLNLSQLGSLRLHMEANLNKFTLKEVPCWNGTDIKGGHAEYWIDNTGLGIGDANPTVLTMGTASTDDTTFMTKKNCPFHVGMKVNFILESTGNTNTTVDAVIKTMTWTPTAATAGPPIDAAGGVVSLTMSNPILDGIVAGAAIDFITMYPIYAATSALDFVKAELVVKTVASPPVAAGLRYRTFETSQDFAPASTTFNRSYEVAGNAVASMVCFDTATGGGEFSSSSEPNVESYQLFVDNVGQTDRKVNIRVAEPYSKHPLHGIMMEKTLEMMGLPYKNNLDTLPKQIDGNATLNDSEIIPESEIFTAEAANRVLVLPVMYESTGARKILNVDLTKNADGENLRLAIFHQVERTITY